MGDLKKPNTSGLIYTKADDSPGALYYVGRFVKGVGGAIESVTIEPIRQVRDMGAAVASVTYNEVIKSKDTPGWYPEMISDTIKAYESGTSKTELILASNPVSGVGVASYHATGAIMDGRYGDLAEQAGGVAGGLAIGKAVQTYGKSSLTFEDIKATGPGRRQAGAVKPKLEIVKTAKGTVVEQVGIDKFSRSMSQRRKALLRDADDPNSGLSQKQRDYIKATNGNNVPPGMEVSHETPLYTAKTVEGKRALDVSDNMKTQNKAEHRARHKVCGDQYHDYPM